MGERRPLHLVLGAVLAGLLAGTTPAPAQDQDAKQAGVAGALHVKQVEIVDRNGFDRPLTAFTILVPSHWQTDGGVVWDPNNFCNRSGYNFAWKAGLPDDSEGVAVLPAITWTSVQGDACPQLQIGSARDLLTVYARQLLPNAQILDYRQRPDLLKDLQSLAYRQDMYGMISEMNVDAGEILLGFTENGRDMRASIAAQVMIWRMSSPAMPTAMPEIVIPGIDIGGGSSLPAFAAVAPAGRLDLRAAEMIRKSIRPGLEWSQKIAQHNATMNRMQAQHASEMSRITSEANAAISDIIHQGYQDRERIRDRTQREQIEAIRGVETYNDPINGGTVQLDNTYSQAWQLQDGSYVLTDDAFFNPVQTFGMTGQQLQVTP